MIDLHELFKVDKPIIGVIHLPTLGRTDLDRCIDFAINEAKKYEECNVDGVILENFMDSPFAKYKLPKSSKEAFRSIAKEVVNNISIPVGINVLRNAGLDALDIALYSGADFIRVNILIGAAITATGYIEGIAYELCRRLYSLSRRVYIFSDIYVKHAYTLYPPTHNSDLETAIYEYIDRGCADVLIVTGARTSVPPPPSLIFKVKRTSKYPVLVGSGVNIDNVRLYLLLSDGLIVGTYFKKNGLTKNPVDVDRVRRFMNYVKRYRSLLI